MSLRFEVWSALAVDGGQRLAILTNVAVASESKKINEVGTLQVTVPLTAGGWDQLREQRALRVVEATGIISDWVITGVVDARTLDTIDTQLTAADPAVRLARGVLVERTEANGTVTLDFDALSLLPSKLITSYVLPAAAAAGITWLTLGTISDAGGPIDLQVRGSSALAVIKDIAAKASLEWQLRPTANGYALDMLPAVGSTAELVDVRLARNLDAITRTADGTAQVTEIIPFGQDQDGIRATMRRAAWLVLNIIGSDVYLGDPAGGAGPIAFDRQLNGLYLQRPDGSLVQVIGSAVATQAVTLASTPGGIGGQLIGFKADSAGRDLVRLKAPTQAAVYGRLISTIEQGDVPEDTNLVSNAAMRQWTGVDTAPADGWSLVYFGGPIGGRGTVAKTTAAGRWQVGGASALMTTSVDGAGLQAPYIPVRPTPANPYLSGFITFWVVTGRVRVEMVLFDGTVYHTFPLEAGQTASSNIIGRWDTLEIAGIDANALNISIAFLRIVQDGPTPATFYVDAAQLTQTGGSVPFIEGSGGTKLWQAANVALVAAADPPRRYDVQIRDLYRLDPATWPYDQLTLGGQVRVTDSEIGAVITTRVLEVDRDLLSAADTRVTLSSKRSDLRDLLDIGTTAPRSANGVTAATDDQTYLGPLRKQGQLAAGVVDSTGRTVNRALAKVLAADPDTADSVVDGALNVMLQRVGWSQQFERATNNQNMLYNPGFEDNGAFWDVANGGSIVTGSGARGGQRYLRLVSTSQFSGSVQQSPKGTTRLFATAAGERWAFGAWIRKISGPASCRVVILGFDAAGSPTTVALSLPIESSVWSASDGEWIVPSGCVAFRIYPENAGSSASPASWSGTEAHYDDVYLRRLTPASDLIDGALRAGISDAGGRVLQRLLAKALAADPDSLDSVGDGAIYRKLQGVAGGLAQLDSLQAAIRQLLGPGTGTNVLTNGGGEEGTVDVQAPGWTFISGAPLTVVDGVARYGSRALRISNATALDSYSYQPVVLQDGRLYELHAWIRVSGLAGPGAGASLNVGLISGVSQTVPIQKYGDSFAADQAAVGVRTLVGTQDWTFCRSLFRAVGTGTAGVFVQLGYGAGVSGTAWFDGIELVEVLPGVDGSIASVGADKLGSGGSSTTIGSTITDASGRALQRLLAKVLIGDPDTLDSLSDGALYRKLQGVLDGVASLESLQNAIRQLLGPGTGSNVIANGGGEVGTVDAAASGWTLIAGNPLTVAADQARYGARSLRIINGTAVDSYSAQQFTLTDGHLYEFRAWVRVAGLAGAGIGAVLNVDIVSGISGWNVVQKIGANVDAASPDVAVLTSVGTQDWTYLRTQFRPVGSGVIQAILQLGGFVGVSGTAWFDGVELVELLPGVDGSIDSLGAGKIGAGGSGVTLGGGIRQSDGSQPRFLLKGAESGVCRNGVGVVYNTTHQAPPLVLLLFSGVVCEPRSASWSAGFDPTLPTRVIVRATNVTVSGFTPVAMLQQVGGVSGRSHTLPSGNLTTVNATAQVGLTSAPAYNMVYSVSYGVLLSNGLSVSKFMGVRVTIDSNDGVGGGWIERFSLWYEGNVPGANPSDGTPGTQSWAETQPLTLGALTGAALIRVRFAEQNGFVGASNQRFVQPGTVTYSVASGVSQASMTPDASDGIPYVVIGTS